ncbi:hypothetical protein E3Q06_00423 [Wallemia mellicola]|nr:hypothetical protein E3Q21_00246 [Wallemia mellicola]TIB92128.1 hypothetical protein E3Q20_00433 [Wallemia mellicola]TIC43761.1 hypothetical protein E3Q07_00423 [Wallemia mellicola]TIC52822.1 hypothetical protein E3Q06_00423 [Wallemia mellicola]
MKFTGLLAIASIIAGTTATWSDGNGDVDDNSFTVIIKDPWKSGLDHANTAAVSVNTKEHTTPFSTHNTFTICGDQCTQYIGLPARDDLPYQPQIHLGANFCNRKNKDNLWINYANQHLDVTSDTRCIKQYNKTVRCTILKNP